MNEKNSLINRAFAAYFRASADGTQETVQPSNDSDIETVNERDYVVLRNVNGILAVYRVRRHDGVLKRLKRWPSALEVY